VIDSRTRAMITLGLAFLLGLIAGGGVVVQAVRSGNAGWIWRGRSNARSGTSSYGASLDRRLHLNLGAVERDSITAISCRSMAAMDSLRAPLRQPMDSLSKQIRPAVDSLFQTIRPAVELRREQARTEIRALLTSPQRERYDSMNRADDEQRKKVRDQGGPPPNGGGPCSGSPGGPGPRGGFDRGSR
jgi:hypothetical protein